MSKSGKILLLFSGLFVVGLYVFRLIYGGWHDSMWVPLVMAILLFIGGLAKDRGALKEFLTMRTTKHGMNMGVLILLTIVGLVCLNYLAVRYEKKFDWTPDKLNSLSDQSVKAAQNLKAETEIVLLFRNTEQNGENIERSVKEAVTRYRDVSPKIKFTAYNALQRPDLAKKYGFDAGASIVFAVQGEQKIKIEQPTEEGITRALLKFGRDKKKTIYFVAGHGERDLEGTDEDGIKEIHDDLNVTYDVRPLVLYQTENKVPPDADVVAIVRPTQQYLEPELQALRDYVRAGGHLLIAIDPGMKHNLAQLTKTVGVEFNNDYVLDLRSQMIKSGPATVLGTTFSHTNDVTRAFNENGVFAIFHIASSLQKDPSVPAGITVEEIVSTDPRTMGTTELGEVRFKPNGPHILAMVAHGKFETPAAKGAEPASGKEFTAVVFSDSDFMSNRLVHNNLNRDLALNAVSSLMEDKDLISIRPKTAKGTVLAMTSQAFSLYILLFLIPVPLLMFFFGGFVWWRRRGA